MYLTASKVSFQISTELKAISAVYLFLRIEYNNDHSHSILVKTFETVVKFILISSVISFFNL